MSEFQKQFMQVVESSNQTNYLIAERYKEDAVSVVNGLFKELDELRYTRARLEEFKEPGRLNQFFIAGESRLQAGFSKYTTDFTKEVNETYKDYDKRFKRLFLEAGISEKAWFTSYESLDEDAVMTAKSSQLKLELPMLNQFKEKVASKSRKIIQWSKVKKFVLGILVPVLLLGLITYGFLKDMEDAKESVSSQTESALVQTGISEDFATQLTNQIQEKLEGLIKIPETVGNLSSVLLIAVVILVIVAVWMLYYMMIAFLAKRQMHRQLEKSIDGLLQRFASEKETIKSHYETLLKSHLNEMNQIHFMKFKSLIDQVNQ